MAPCGPVRIPFLGPNVYPEVPDGGWGWLVAVAFFLVEVFTYGTIKSFGIFLQDLMEEFEETNSRVSWIVSICVFVMTFNGPLSSILTSRFGFQLVVMTGGFLISTGTIATSFTTSVNQMYFTYGLVAGLGYCLTFLPTVTILSQYFNRRRSLVTAVASTGESLAMFALAPAFSALRDQMGWRHTMAVMGSLQGTIVICGALLRPIIIKPRPTQTDNDESSKNELEALSPQKNVDACGTKKLSFEADGQDSDPSRHSVSTGDSGVQSLKDNTPEEGALLQKEAGLPTEEEKLAKNCNSYAQESEQREQNDRDVENQVTQKSENVSAKKLIDFSILRERSFILYSLFGLFATLGFFAPPLYIIELSVSRGVEREHATYMLSTMAVAEILGRFSIGWILTRKQFLSRKLLVLLGCVIMMTVDLVGFTLVQEFYGLAVCCAVYGFFMGTLACTHIPMLAEDDVVGIERMSSAAGVYVFIQSFAGLAGPPLGGVLVDITNNYGSAFYSCAVGMAVSAVFLGLVRPAKRGLICSKRNSKCREDTNERMDDAVEQPTDRMIDRRNDSPEDFTKIDVNVDDNQKEATRNAEEVISFA